MENRSKKSFLARHSKSSAMVVSLVIHAILAVVALSFVAVTVVTKSDQKFESRQVVRPRMPPKKLQVPVKIKKKRPKPKMRQRIVVKNNIRNMPDIKMPEISGIKGGLGVGGSGTGLGDAVGIGFSMPEINVFGIRSRGEKVFIALDSDAYIMRDEVGGKRAYEIIKSELVRIIEKLGPTTLFNLAVFEHSSAVALFPSLVPATRENVAKVKKWIEPLNATKVGTTGTYGIKTLGKDGTQIRLTDRMKGGLEQAGPQHWFRPAAMAMAEQADTVFILSGWWGVLRKTDGEAPEWKLRDRWEQYRKLAEEKHKEENKRRAANGEPEQVIRDQYQLMQTYYPNQYKAYYPPQPPWYRYTAQDFEKALRLVRKENAPKLPAKSGLTKRKKDRFSLNVVFFAPKNEVGPVGHYEEVAKRCNGEFRVLKGLKAIESSRAKE